jgi:hypothetical protein
MSKIIPFLLLGFFLSACAGFPVSTQAPEPLGTPTSPENMACDIPETWTLQFHRSGGFAGFDESMTLDSGGKLTVQSERPLADVQEMISGDQVNEIANLLAGACPFEIQESNAQCEDCFVYELVIQMNGETYQVEATDVTLTEELHPLVNQLSGLLQNSEE